MIICVKGLQIRPVGQIKPTVVQFQQHPFVYILSMTAFILKMAQISSGNRESITLKDKNICHMAFSRESLHTLNLCNKSSRIHKLE